MNKHPSRPADPAPVDEREWLAQEQALSMPSGRRADALLARALRSLPASRPPPGFAAEVARLAAAGPHQASAVDARLERLMLNVLLGLLALASIGAAAWYGNQWWALASQALGAGAAQWALLGAACLLLSWLPEAARRVHGDRPPETA
ncbi:hypothetical protein ACW5EG_01235 [Luteimonas sp. A611]